MRLTMISTQKNSTDNDDVVYLYEFYHVYIQKERTRNDDVVYGSFSDNFNFSMKKAFRVYNFVS